MDTIVLPQGRFETKWWGPAPDQAPTLVLLHEGLGCVALWRDVPELLSKATGYGVLAYSRFGYGGSDPKPLPWGPDYMHREALEVLPLVLDKAGIRQAVMIGHSDGGSIAAIHAGATNDDRILGIVTLAAHFFVEDMNIASIEAIRTQYETTELRSRLARYHRDVDCAFYGWNGGWLDPAFGNFDIAGYLEAIRKPYLGLQGTDDPYGTAEQLRILAEHARFDTETKMIANAKHSPHLEAKDESIALIADFVRRKCDPRI